MMYPPSLPSEVRARAFRATNGELGILPADAPSFLAACRSDDVKILGWELWVVDHQWSIETNLPAPAKGSWCGGIPMRYDDVPAIVGGEGNGDETERQLAALNIRADVRPEWQPHVRVNFTLDGQPPPPTHSGNLSFRGSGWTMTLRSARTGRRSLMGTAGLTAIYVAALLVGLEVPDVLSVALFAGPLLIATIMSALSGETTRRQALLSFSLAYWLISAAIAWLVFGFEHDAQYQLWLLVLPLLGYPAVLIATLASRKSR